MYVPEQAVLPEELVAELGLTGKLAGSAPNRVKAIRLRGELSRGVVCRPGRSPAWTWRGRTGTGPISRRSSGP